LSKKDPKSELGRGIRALLNDLPDFDSSAETTRPMMDGAKKESAAAELGPKGNIEEVALHLIEANPNQPRRQFDQNALQELAASIETQGLIQPITVRPKGSGYEIISGERRWRAAKLAGLKTAPVYIRTVNDTQILEMALIENIQREDLNAIEIGVSYQRLIDECSITQDELAIRVGKDRSTISNYLRLLRLPPNIREALQDGKISMGHARALLSSSKVEVQLTVFREILEKSLSVRNVEALMRSYNNPEPKTSKKKPSLSPDFLKVQENLRAQFETKVSIRKKDGKRGEIVIPFFSDNDFNRILDLLED